MLDRLRLFGAMAFAVAPTSPNTFGLPGLMEKSSMVLLSSTPVFGAMYPVPKNRLTEIVAATRLPSASSTEKCVVCIPAGSDSMPGNRLDGMALSVRMLLRCPAA